MNLGLVQDRELELVGTLMYVRDDFSAALTLLKDRDVAVERLLTHRFSLSQAAEAFAVADRRQGVVKVIVEVLPESAH